MDGAARGRLHFLSALRYPNYRYYWFGLMATVFGQQVLIMSEGWLVYDLTHSTALLGVTAAANALPQLALTTFTGVVADRVDRRKLLMGTQIAYGLVELALALLLATGQISASHIEQSMVLLVGAAALAGTVQAFDQPARMALVPQLLDARGEELLNAMALQNMVWQTTAIVGPAVGGLLIAWVGVAACYFITSASVLGMVFCLYRMRLFTEPAAARRQSVLHNIREGFGFIRGHTVISSLLAVIFFNALFGLSFQTMVPAFARDVLHTDASGQGFMMGAFGFGALAGNLVLASAGRGEHAGKLVVWGGLGFGLALVAFAWSPWFGVSLGLLAALGILRAVYFTTASTSLQALVPNELRGRVMGVFGLTWSLMPLGGLLSGSVAAVTSPSFAVGMGGALVALFALALMAKAPQVRTLSMVAPVP